MLGFTTRNMWPKSAAVPTLASCVAVVDSDGFGHASTSLDASPEGFSIPDGSRRVHAVRGDTSDTLARWDMPRDAMPEVAGRPYRAGIRQPTGARRNLVEGDGSGLASPRAGDEPVSVTPNGPDVCPAMTPSGPACSTAGPGGPACSTPSTGCPGPDDTLLSAGARRQVALGSSSESK